MSSSRYTKCQPRVSQPIDGISGNSVEALKSELLQREATINTQETPDRIQI